MLKKIKPQYLLQLASEASINAYAPYSNFHVGACALFDDSSTYKGCNVENISYGLSLCAERTALSSAVTNGKAKGLIAIAIFSSDSKLCYPCGACRQWMVEFSKNTVIILENIDGSPVTYKISELLPLAFELTQNPD